MIIIIMVIIVARVVAVVAINVVIWSPVTTDGHPNGRSIGRTWWLTVNNWYQG